jgi:hypothetical protein
MGKKHVTETSQEETIKESEKVDQNLKKEVKVKSALKITEAESMFPLHITTPL